MSHKITDKWQKYLRENKKVEEKFSPDDFKDVYNTARMAHVGQTRRDGSEYFSHPSEVRNITAKFYPKDRVAQLAALLHDSLEDAPGSTVSSEEEMEEFIRGSIQDPAAGDEVIRVVRALTHEKGGDYLSYVVDLMGDEPTLRVKLSDMVHNLTDNPSPKQKAKYKSALDAIAAKTGGSAPSGISDKHWDTLMGLASDEVNEVLSKDTYDAINKKVDEFGYNAEGLYELVLKIFNQMGDSEVSSMLGKLKEGITKEQLATIVAEKVLDKFDGDYQRSIVKPKKLSEKSPCWDGYEQIGMKVKDGKEVPNCVPIDEEVLEEAEYQGKKVTLNDPIRTPGESKKFKVYVKNDKGNVVVVRFGDPDMEIRRDNPEARKSFRARHDCANKEDKTTAGYWSCWQWRAGAKVDS